MQMWRCVTCNSDDVEMPGWVNPNTYDVSELDPDSTDESWCNTCNKSTTIYFDDEYEQDSTNEDEEIS